MIASAVDRRRAAEGRADDPAGVPGHRPAQRGGRVLHLHAGARVPAALRRLRARRAASTASRCAATSTSRPRAPAILVCNHVSFVDAVLLMAASPRPIRFIMDHRIFARAGARLAVPARQGDPDRAAEGRPGDLRAAFERGRPGARRRRPARASSPKARSRATARCSAFKGGVMKILERHPVPVVPVALQQPVGLVLLARRRRQGDGAAVPARAAAAASGWSPVKRLPASAVSPPLLHQRVSELLAEPGAAV